MLLLEAAAQPYEVPMYMQKLTQPSQAPSPRLLEMCRCTQT